MTLPDRFIDHDTPQAQIVQAGLDSRNIVQVALQALGIGEAESPAVTGSTTR